MGFLIGAISEHKSFPKDYNYPEPPKMKKELALLRRQNKQRFLGPDERVFCFDENGNPIKGRVQWYNDTKNTFMVMWDPKSDKAPSVHYRSDPEIHKYND